jgi:hypothetical protein
VDSRQLLTPGRNACSPETREVVEAALARFAARLCGSSSDRPAVFPDRQLIRWFLGAPSAGAPEVAIPSLQAHTAPPPPGVAAGLYREWRTALLRVEASTRRDRLVAFYAKGQKAKAAEEVSIQRPQDSQSADNAMQEDADGSHGAGGAK